MPKVQMPKSTLLCALLLAVPLAGCAHTVMSPNARCSSLIPPNWADGVPAVPLPGFEDVGEVVGAFIEQTGQLDKANGRTADAIHIVSTCEAQINETRERPRFLGIF